MLDAHDFITLRDANESGPLFRIRGAGLGDFELDDSISFEGVESINPTTGEPTGQELRVACRGYDATRQMLVIETQLITKGPYRNASNLPAANARVTNHSKTNLTRCCVRPCNNLGYPDLIGDAVFMCGPHRLQMTTQLDQAGSNGDKRAAILHRFYPASLPTTVKDGQLWRRKSDSTTWRVFQIVFGHVYLRQEAPPNPTGKYTMRRESEHHFVDGKEWELVDEKNPTQERPRPSLLIPAFLDPLGTSRTLFNPQQTYDEFVNRMAQKPEEPAAAEPAPNTREYANLHFGARALTGPLTMPLAAIETKARVWRPTAQHCDFAYGRVGRVVREDGMVGVLYDGASHVMQYRDEDNFAYVPFE